LKAEAKLVAGAILGAGGMIGAGLYFGLAAGRVPIPEGPLPVETNLTKVSAVGTTRLPSAATSQPEPKAPPIPSVLASSDEVVRRLVAAQHATLRERCWHPDPPSASATVRVRFLFVSGKQQALSVEELPDHPTLAECLRKHLAPLEIPDDGPAVASMVAVSFP
jgi:hypothetical protein